MGVINNVVDQPAELLRPWEGVRPFAKSTVEMDHWIGMRLRHRRQEVGIGPADLALEVGVSRQQIDKWERAEVRMLASRLYDCSIALRCSPAFFFEGLAGADPFPQKVYDMMMLMTDPSMRVLKLYHRLAPEQAKLIDQMIVEMMAANRARESGPVTEEV